MINLLEGVPGSGKSYEAVVYHVLPALKAGRKVITNLPLRLDAFAALNPDFLDLIELRRESSPILGRWDAEAANRGERAFIVGEFTEAERDGVRMSMHAGKEALLPVPGARLFGGVWDFYDEWRGEGNIGPLFVIDECHVSFPRENVRKQRFTPDEVIQWFKISRHFGVDVLLMTQRMRALDEDVAGLAEMHIRVRKAAFMGQQNEYVRKVFAGYRGGEVSSDIRPYKPQFFGLYKSHTQGAAVIEAAASDVAPANVKWRRLSRGMFLLSAVLAVATVMWAMRDKPKPKPMPKPSAIPQVAKPYSLVNKAEPLNPSTQVASAVNGAAQHVSPGVPPNSAPAPVFQSVSWAKDPAPEYPEPMQDRGMHITGCLKLHGETRCVVVVSQNGQRIFTVSDVELREMGYGWRRVADCAAVITWGNKARTIICDSPQVGVAVAGSPVSGGGQQATVKTVDAPPAEVRTLPMPEIPKPDPNLITQADIPRGLALKNPAYTGGVRGGPAQGS